jgi:adenylate kinase
MVLGTAGMKKEAFIEKVVNIAYQQNFVKGRANPESKGFIEVYHLDGSIKKGLGGLPKYAAYLDNPNPQSQQEIWDGYCNKILEKIKRSNTTHAFLVLHGTYYRNKRYFSRLNWSLLRQFKPNIILTLIDDAYDVSQRIAQVESKLETRSECTFNEAIEWRTVEIMMGDTLSQNLIERKKLPHFVLAIKHPPETAYRLLFERWRLVLYAAFPISDTRLNDDAVKEINRFREKMHHEFTMFDPVTIDEYPVAGKLVKRWPLCGGVSARPNVEVREIKRIEKSILENIEARDFRYVSEAEGLVAYRPFWGKRQSPSRGVDREMIQALNENKPIYVVHDRKDGVLSERQKLFQPIERAQVKSSVNQIVRELQKWQDENKKQRKTQRTWDS